METGENVAFSVMLAFLSIEVVLVPVGDGFVVSVAVNATNNCVIVADVDSVAGADGDVDAVAMNTGVD